MTGILLEPLNTLQKLSHTLFLSLSPAQNKPPPPPPTDAFIEADVALASALQKTRLHQVNQRKIVALTAEVLELESRLRDIWMELEKGKRDLEEVIEEGNERVKAIGKAKEGTSIKFFSSCNTILKQDLPSCSTLPRVTCIRSESKCIYFRAT